MIDISQYIHNPILTKRTFRCLIPPENNSFSLLLSSSGFLHIALKKYKGNRSKEVHYSPAVLTYITHLMYKAKKIADKSIPVLERTLSEKDLRNNRPLFSNEWTYIHPYIELNRSLIFDFKTSNFGGKAMEPYAGKCWFNILGTYKKDTKRCTVPEICWKVMRRHNTYGAYLTHQTIYYGISEIMGKQPCSAFDENLTY